MTQLIMHILEVTEKLIAGCGGEERWRYSNWYKDVDLMSCLNLLAGV